MRTVHLDPAAVRQLEKSLEKLGYQGGEDRLRDLLVHAERDTADRDMLGLWGMPGSTQRLVVARILAHARKHDLWRHPGQRHSQHLTFWSLQGGMALRLGSVEFASQEIRLVFFRENSCRGYLRLNWQGGLIERVRSQLR